MKVKQEFTWGMFFNILAYDSIVSGMGFIEKIVGALPLAGDFIKTLINEIGGLLVIVGFIAFIGKKLWKDRFTLTTIVGVITPFMSLILPLTTLGYILESKLLKE